MATDVATKFDVRVLGLDSVEPDPRNIRRQKITPESVETLRAALRVALQRGEEFDQPITVYPIGAGRHRIKHGHRRFAAAQLEGVKQLHFHLVDPPSEHERILDQLDDNLNSRSNSHLDIGYALKALQETTGASQGQLVSILREHGIPGAEGASGKTWVQQHLGLITLPEEVQDLVEAGAIGYSVAVKLKRLPSRQDQVSLARRIVQERLSSREVSALLGLDGIEAEGGDDALASRDLLSLPATPEAGLMDLREQLSEAAERQLSPEQHQRAYDAERRSSAVEKRFEFPSRLEAPRPASAQARKRLQQLTASAWAAEAPGDALKIAQDLVSWGQCTVEDATALALECLADFPACSETMQRLLVGLRVLLDGHDGMPPHSIASLFKTYFREFERRSPAPAPARTADGAERPSQ